MLDLSTLVNSRSLLDLPFYVPYFTAFGVMAIPLNTVSVVLLDLMYISYFNMQYFCTPISFQFQSALRDLVLEAMGRAVAPSLVFTLLVVFELSCASDFRAPAGNGCSVTCFPSDLSRLVQCYCP